MAEFLDQSEIDKVMAEMKINERKEKIKLSLTAKEKLGIIYEDVISTIMENELNTIQDIGDYVLRIGGAINSDNNYYLDFKRLETSYEKKVMNY